MTRPRALVLVAGLGTRLRPLTLLRAKGAVPVNGDPLACRVVSWLVSQDVTDLVLNLHHLPATLTGVIGDGSALGARVRYSWEQPVLGSAGGPRHALPLLTDALADRTRPERFLIVNGDTLTDVAIDALLDAHDRSGALVTMALVPNPEPDKYGGVRVSDRDMVLGFTRPGTPGESWHFVGVQVAEAAAFADIPDGTVAESVTGLYPELLRRDPGAISAFRCRALFRDIGTPRDYLRTSVELAGVEGDRLAAGLRVSLAPSARLVRTAVWDDVSIGPDAELVDCVVCDGVAVPAGARYRRCALLPATVEHPGPGARLDGALLVKELWT